jgi:2-dehydro-3-deoxy-D-arabinonate dehydratase
MLLTRHQTPSGPRWAADGRFLPRAFTLDLALEFDKSRLADAIRALLVDEPAAGVLLPPVEPTQEVWASGVTYLRSRDARKAESTTGDIYQKVYEAERPELFFKAAGWRVVGPGDAIRVRADSRWNVPEPELTLLINRRGQIVGYCAGNDVSSRDIEGDNPLYLPQAKVYNGSCALGPGIVLAGPDEFCDLAIGLQIARGGQAIFEGETRTSRMKRSFEDLAAYLFRELDFPRGVFLMTGTGIVPHESFSLASGDRVRVEVGDLVLENETRG